MVISMMTLILAYGRNMKWVMALTLYLVTLNNILEIIYIYGSLNQLIEKNILLRVTTFIIYKRMCERGGLFKSKGR